MFSSKPKFDANKCKTNLKMLINRFQLLVQKKTNLNKQQKRKVALLLRDDKAAEAEVLVEHIIREDYTIESYELLRQYSEMILARFNVVVTEAELRPEVAEAVCAILYSGYLMGNDVPELKTLNLLFTAKYGLAYAEEVKEHKEKYLNHRLLGMLTSTQVPDRSVTRVYLIEIAKAYGVSWTPPPENLVPQPMSASLGVPLPLPGMPFPLPSMPGIAADTPQPPQPVQPAAPMPSPPGVPVGTGVPVTAPPIYASGAAGSGIPFSLQLTKGADGFGMSLDSDNVVLSVKAGSEAERSGLIQPGDQVLALNETQVSQDQPVKSVAIDVDEGASATFSMVRHREAAAPPAAPVEGYGLPPSVGGVAYGLPPAAPPLNAYGLPPADHTPPAAGPSSGEPVVAQPVAAPPVDGAENEDDALARRLEMLKRG